MLGSGKEKGDTFANGAQSWRELSGPRRRTRLNTPQARRRRQRRWLKWLGIMAIVAVLLGLLRSSDWQFDPQPGSLQITPPSKPIERILFDTDGVLPDAWLSRTVELRPGMSMMQADIHALQQTLQAQPQVKSARVERVFPSDLRIVISERQPALRLAVASANGTRQRIVARDGSVYDGIGYPRATLKHLPFLQPYQHADGSFFPLRGIERVAELLEWGRQHAPELFSTWQVVSLEHYSGDLHLPGQVFEVGFSFFSRILFRASVDFDSQLDSLKNLLDDVQLQCKP